MPRLVYWCNETFTCDKRVGGRERVWVGRAMRMWLFRKSEPKWGAVLPTQSYSGWETAS